MSWGLENNDTFHFFRIEPRRQRKNPILAAWHPDSRYVATTTGHRVIHLRNRGGSLVNSVVLPQAAECTFIEWDPTGRFLIIIQAGGAYRWVLESLQLEPLPVDDPTFLKFNHSGTILAVGTRKGDIFFLDAESWKRKKTLGGQIGQKRILCGEWSADDLFAFASESRQISVVSVDGTLHGQVRGKSRANTISFGPQKAGTKQNVVSVGVEKKTILLCYLEEPEKALELAFQPRYGDIVGFLWFQGDKLMVAFSLGHLVVISTNPEEVGREKFCTRLHTSIRDLAYSPIGPRVVACSDSTVKVIKVDSEHKKWKIERCIDVKNAGTLEKISWTKDGTCFSVSSKTGCLHVFVLDTSMTQGSIQHGGFGLSNWFGGPQNSGYPLLEFMTFLSSFVFLFALLMFVVYDVSFLDVARVVFLESPVI